MTCKCQNFFTLLLRVIYCYLPHSARRIFTDRCYLDHPLVFGNNLLQLPNPWRMAKKFGNLFVIPPHSDSPIIRGTSNENPRLLVFEKICVKNNTSMSFQFMQNASSIRVPNKKQAKNSSSCNQTPVDVNVAWIKQTLLFFAKYSFSLLITQIDLFNEVMSIEYISLFILLSDSGDSIHALLIMVVVECQSCRL